MPIVSIKEIQARRAARAAQEAAEEEAMAALPVAAPEPIIMPEPVSATPVTEEIHHANTPDRKSRRGHAVKNASGKWEPTGNYDQGFAKPPREHQFKPGGKGGPGRPKSTIDYDEVTRKHLLKKQTITINGEAQRMTVAEIAIVSEIRDGLKGTTRSARQHILAEASRLFPRALGVSSGGEVSGLTPTDIQIIDRFFSELDRSGMAADKPNPGRDA